MPETSKPVGPYYDLAYTAGLLGVSPGNLRVILHRLRGKLGPRLVRTWPRPKRRVRLLTGGDLAVIADYVVGMVHEVPLKRKNGQPKGPRP